MVSPGGSGPIEPYPAGIDIVIGEVVDRGFLKTRTFPVLRMEDTRMPYGG